jgi:hypothetical protein
MRHRHRAERAVANAAIVLAFVILAAPLACAQSVEDF